MRVKRILSLLMAAVAFIALAYSMEWHSSYWAKYLHLIAMVVLFLILGYKYEQSEERKNKNE